MRPKNFNIKEVIDALNGTCDSIDDTVNNLYGIDDFDYFSDATQEELEILDGEIFMCTACGWWEEQPAEEDEYGEWICTSCSIEDDEEEEYA